jgi:hypothetical protein
MSLRRSARRSLAVASFAGAACLVGCGKTPIFTAKNVAAGEDDGTTPTSGASGSAGSPTTAGGGGAGGAGASSAEQATAGASGGNDGTAGASVGGGTCDALALADPSIPRSTQQVPGCPCTRRPGLGQDPACPVGVGESAEADIGPDGGTITLLGQQGRSSGMPLKVTFLPRTFNQPTHIKVTETAVPPPKEYIDASPVYLIEPRGPLFQGIVSVDVPFGSTAKPPDLSIVERLEPICVWVPDGDSFPTFTGTFQGILTERGYFFIGAPKTNPACP